MNCETTESCVAVIVPIYNTSEEVLRKCIESLIFQTLKNIEIVLIDDGSKNSSLKICQEYAREDNRITVKRQINQGVSVARNYGIEISQSPYIAFVDSDDCLASVALEAAYGCLEKGNHDLVIWDHKVISANSVKTDIINIHSIDKEFIEESDSVLFVQGIMMGAQQPAPSAMQGGPWCKLYKRNIIDKIHLRFRSELKRSQDNEFNFRYMNYVNSIVYLKCNLYYYRQLSNSATQRFRPQAISDMDAFLSILKEDIDKSKNRDKLLDGYNEVVIAKYADICRTYFAHPENPDSRKDITKEMKQLFHTEPYLSAFTNNQRYCFEKLMKITFPLLKKGYFSIVYFLFIFRYYINRHKL